MPVNVLSFTIKPIIINKHNISSTLYNLLCKHFNISQYLFISQSDKDKPLWDKEKASRVNWVRFAWTATYKLRNVGRQNKRFLWHFDFLRNRSFSLIYWYCSCVYQVQKRWRLHQLTQVVRYIAPCFRLIAQLPLAQVKWHIFNMYWLPCDLPDRLCCITCLYQLV